MISIEPLKKELLSEAVDLVLKAGLDTREEIEHHLEHVDAHFVAIDNGKVAGVIGWYQDNVNYANEAMGEKFPGTEAYWVGFFAVDDNHRGQGVGADLLGVLEKTVGNLGARELWVSSVPETKSYYLEHGFELVSAGTINGNQKFFCVKKLD